jgi:amino-acid N-acetyltransferase
MKISFRKAIDSDNEILRSILLSQHLPVESIGTGVTDFYIGSENGAIVGIGGFEYYGDDVLLRSVAVPTNLQSRCIGSQIVDWMLDVATQKGFKRVFLLTETASAFFAKKGFTIINRSLITNNALKKSTQFSGGCCNSATCMSKLLAK